MATRDPVASHLSSVINPGAQPRPRLTILGTPGLAYLRALTCAALIEQGFDVDLFSGSIHSYDDWLVDRRSDLYLFHPDIVLVIATTKERIESGSFTWTRQELGASVLQRSILPILSPEQSTEGPASSESRFALLKDPMSDARSRSKKHNIEFSFPRKKGQPEALVSWRLSPRWRRGNSEQATLLREHPVSHWLVSLFGGAYTWLAVDMATHPSMAGARRDLTAFMSQWELSRLQRGSGRQEGLSARPDSFLFVDWNPFGIRSAAGSIRGR